MQITIDIKERFKDVVDAGARILSDTLEMVAQSVWGNVRIEAPVDQGRLAGSFTLDRLDAMSYSVATNVSYAMAVHEGRAAREIVPVNALALFWRGARHPVKRVSQGPVAPNRYADRAIEKTVGRVNEFADIAADKARQEYNL